VRPRGTLTGFTVRAGAARHAALPQQGECVLTTGEPIVLDVEEGQRRIDELAGVLVDAVASGASVSFMHPFGHRDAVAFWRKVLASVGEGSTVLLAALADGTVQGTVQLQLATPPNQPHRAEVAKLLVHRRARRQGLAARLMAALEREALARGRTLLTLDTHTGGPAERLYERLGWSRVGIVPGYALLPDGLPGDTTIFYKRLS
jgi:GNAT superfamily N-acetyltransferase